MCPCLVSAHLGIPVRLWVVLGRVLAHQLLRALNLQLPQRFDEQLQYSWLVIGLEHDLRVSELLDILDNRVHRETLLVDAFLRDQSDVKNSMHKV